MRIHWILFICCVFSLSSLRAQDSSLNNNTGNWTDNGSWTSGAAPPNDDVIEDITINGYITLQNDNLDLQNGGGHTLTINDTLVIEDNAQTSRFFAGNTVVVNGLLVVMGNLNVNTGTSFTVNSGGIVAVGGNFNKFGGGDPNLGAGTVYVEGTSGYTDVSPADDLEGDGHGNIGDFLDGTSSTLPVEMIYFVATVSETSATLNWATSSELNNSGFEVEKSENAVDFNKIGFVVGHGTVNTEKRYSFKDLSFDGQAYYRLKQIDFDGAYEYFEIIEARNDLSGDLKVSVFPNPTTADKNLNIFFDKSRDEEVRISMSSADGRIISADFGSYQSSESVQLDLSGNNLVSGYYILMLETDSRKLFRKVLIK